MGGLAKTWTKEDIDWLISNYPKFGLVYCAEKLKRSIPSIRQRAYELKLKSNFKHNPISDYNRGSAFRGKTRPEHSKLLINRGFFPAKSFTDESKRKISSSVKIAIGEGRIKNDNFKGHNHSSEAKKKISEASKKMWSNPNSFVNSSLYRQSISDRSSAFQQSSPTLNRYSRGNGSHETIGGINYYFRSSWEVVYANYLEFLLNKKQIKKWEYEVDTFWFEKIRRGVRSYKPDFKITNLNGKVEYHEVKGWMDRKSATKIKRMALYYPDVKLVIIGKDEYKEIKKWERLFNK
jgi:hypothetical protein